MISLFLLDVYDKECCCVIKFSQEIVGNYFFPLEALTGGALTF